MEANLLVPKLIFKYAFPLDRNRRELYKKNKLGEYPSVEVVKSQRDRLQNLWQDFEKTHGVIRRISELTGVVIARDFEIYIFGGGLNPMSKPLMMPIIRRGRGFFEDSQFIEIVTHELCHRFAGDEEETPRLTKYWDYIRDKYINESTLTRSHIIVYALLGSVLETIEVPDHPEYLKAYQVVKKQGAKEILNEFKRLTT